MTRIILPLPILLALAFLVALFWGFQAIVGVVASSAMSEAVWSGPCQQQSIEVRGDDIVMTLLCNGEKATTKTRSAIVAWVNDQQEPECTKTEWWNSDDVSWSCAAPETIEAVAAAE